MDVSETIIKRKERRASLRRDKKANFFLRLGAACVVCGQTEPLFLDFHHVGPKCWKISTLLNRSLSAPLSNWPRLLQAELSQCVPLCVLCHRRLHGGVLTLTAEQEAQRVQVDVNGLF